MEGDLLYLKSTDSTVNLIFKNTFTETSIIMLDKLDGYYSLAMLMQKIKIDHHSHM